MSEALWWCLNTCKSSFPQRKIDLQTEPHNFIKDKLIDLIERTFQREVSPHLACSDRNAFLRVVVSYKRKYVHKLLVNRLFKPAQENVWLDELTVPQ